MAQVPRTLVFVLFIVAIGALAAAGVIPDEIAALAAAILGTASHAAAERAFPPVNLSPRQLPTPRPAPPCPCYWTLPPGRKVEHAPADCPVLKADNAPDRATKPE